MVDWKHRLKRMFLAYVRMWRLICGELYGAVLSVIYLILLFLPILILYSLTIQNLYLSISLSNSIFYSFILINFPLSLYLTSKIMDYMDIHNWFE